MKKIPTLFVRGAADRALVTREVTPGCEWVTAGEGVATRKFDGTCCLVRGGRLYKRRELRGRPAMSLMVHGYFRPDGFRVSPEELAELDQSQPLKDVPENFEPVQYDPVTVKAFGWIPVGEGPEDQYHREAWENFRNSFRHYIRPIKPDGELTCELIGPKIQGGAECRFMREHFSKEHAGQHHLIAHGGQSEIPDCPRTFDGLRSWLAEKDIEGVVWHHPDGRMAKIKKKDFGLPRQPEE